MRRLSAGTVCYGGSALFLHYRWNKTPARQPYRRRTSDPRTQREKGNFQRDLKFSKHRSLPDVLWMQDKARTYMDDAERLYGRKETWKNIEDDVLREKLAALLKDYVRDMIDATKLEVRDANKYMKRCVQMESRYRSCVAAASFFSPRSLRAWMETSPEGTVTGTGVEDKATSNDDINDNTIHPAGEDQTDETQSELTALKEFADSRRRRGERAILEDTPATSGMSKMEQQNMPYSAFPFLRQRALENESSLDPSLVDWTAKYYPEDNLKTFSSPPKLQTDVEPEGKSQESVPDGVEVKNVPDSPSSRTHARFRLQRSLRLHEDLNRTTFDAEGAFYRVRRQSNEDERAPKPKPARGSDARNGRDAEVVKVSWGTVAKAKEMGYSADNLRAKERLIRLSRGEDPQTIP